VGFYSRFDEPEKLKYSIPYRSTMISITIIFISTDMISICWNLHHNHTKSAALFMFHHLCPRQRCLFHHMYFHYQHYQSCPKYQQSQYQHNHLCPLYQEHTQKCGESSQGKWQICEEIRQNTMSGFGERNLLWQGYYYVTVYSRRSSFHKVFQGEFKINTELALLILMFFTSTPIH